MSHAQTRRRRYAPREREVRLRITREPSLPPGLTIVDRNAMCICVGCYYVATEQSGLCLRCEMSTCTNEENRHA